jgi:hypothetical protein
MVKDNVILKRCGHKMSKLCHQTEDQVTSSVSRSFSEFTI